MAIRRTTKGKGANYRSTKSGAGMTQKGVAAYRRANPGSKLKTAVNKKNYLQSAQPHPLQETQPSWIWVVPPHSGQILCLAFPVV